MIPQPLINRFAVDTYSYTLRTPVRACLERLAGHGFVEFELQMYPGHLWPAEVDKAARRELRDFLVGSGLRVATLNMPNIDLNIAAANAEMRKMTLTALRAVIVLAGDLGVEGVVLGPGKANPLLPMAEAQLMDYFRAALDELVPLAGSAGTSIYLENMPFAFLPRMADLLEAIEAYGERSIGIVYDVANGHFVQEDIAQALRSCAPRLRAVHLSDTDLSSYRHAAVGLGTVDFRPLPALLTEIGFNSRPILEIVSADPDQAIIDSARQLLAMGF